MVVLVIVVTRVHPATYWHKAWLPFTEVHASQFDVVLAIDMPRFEPVGLGAPGTAVGYSAVGTRLPDTMVPAAARSLE